jgi:hypothetical protein
LEGTVLAVGAIHTIELIFDIRSGKFGRPESSGNVESLSRKERA